MSARSCRAALGLMVLVAAAWPACASSPPAPAPPRVIRPRALTPDEAALRTKLGVPADAKTVVIFGQAAHLDVDWQKTFDDYYQSYVGDIFLEARKILDAQPRAFYTITEMAFLRHHLEVHPEELAAFQAHAQRGALHIVGGGVTSPDTLLPESEMLFRDWLYGIQFAEDTIGVRPRSAYLPDSFGHGATAPDVLAAAGYDSVAISRIDGATDLYQQIFQKGDRPLPGSTAALLEQLGTADFLWRGSGGATVLAHFMAAPGLYCAGDNIDYEENLEVPGGHLGVFRGDDPAYTDAQIDAYVAASRPYARTPYLFVPVGCDFQHPKDALVSYLDGYDGRRYPTTHAWAVAAPFDDYAALVGAWRDVLPEVTGELSPLYMGFYGSRADVKRGTRDAARPFFVAEAFATALGDEGRAVALAARPSLEMLARTDHHDFVTGTAADDVVANEQLPLLAGAEATGQSELSHVASLLAYRVPVAPGDVARVVVFNASSVTRDGLSEVTLPLPAGATPALHATAGGQPVPLEVVGGGPNGASLTVRLALAQIPPFAWRMVDLLPGSAAASPAVSLALLDASGAPATGGAVTRVVLSNARVRAQWDKAGDFRLTSLTVDGAEAIAQGTFTVNDYADQGGLWRLGHEMKGCTFTPSPPPGGDETLAVLESTSLVARVAWRSASGQWAREASLGAGDAGLDLAITTGAAQGSTRTVSIAFAAGAGDALTTSLPGGYAARPAERLYTPTFWPAVGWAQVGGWALLLRQSTGVRMSTPGQMEIMAARDARNEQCDVMGGQGSDAGTHRIEMRIERAMGPADAERAAQAYDRPLDAELVDLSQGKTLDLPPEQSLLSVSGGGIVSALKPADRGAGVVLRALLLSGPVTVQLGPALVGKTMTRIDLAERDVAPMGPALAALVLDPAIYGSIASVRLE